MEKEINIIMLCGLPGSGKTYLSKKILKETNKQPSHQAYIIDMDKYINSPISDKIWGSEVLMYYSYTTIILDGLFLTDESRKNILSSLMKYLTKYKKGLHISIEFHAFEENREACLNNDSGRRIISSEIAIKNAEYTLPDINVIREALVADGFSDDQMDMNLVTHPVHWATEYEKFFAPKANNPDRYPDMLFSKSWSNGGEWGDCWGNSGTVSPESPVEFTELDALLEEMCPNITFLNYKKITKECVTIDEYTEGGYYGSYEYKCRYVCDLKKLYELLKSFK